MPPVTESFNINRPGLERDIVLHLDPECFSQRLMLDCFRSGRLLEPETSALVDILLQPGDAFIDMAGHVGFFPCLRPAWLALPAGSTSSSQNGLTTRTCTPISP